MNEVIFSMTNKEAAFLAALTGAKEFLGLDDHVFSLSEQEIRDEWASMQRVLEDRRYIEADFGGNIVIDEVIHAVLKTCCECDSYVSVSSMDAAGLSSETNYYVTPLLAVKMTEEKESDLCSFEVLRTTGALRESLRMAIPLAAAKTEDAGVTINASLLEEMKEAGKSGMATANRALTEAGYDEAAAVRLSNLLLAPKDFVTMVRLDFKENNKGTVHELMMAGNDNGLWRIKAFPGEDVSYHISTLAAEGGEAEFAQWFSPLQELYEYGREELS